MDRHVSMKRHPKTVIHTTPGLLHLWEGHHQCQIVHSVTPTAAKLVGTFSRERLGVIEKETYCGTPRNLRSAAVYLFSCSSKPFSRKGTQKFSTMSHLGDRGDRRGAVAAR